MRGSIPTHALVLLALLGWTVVATVRERLGIGETHAEPAPRPTPPKRDPVPRSDPSWIWIN
jgi:hypothetical protein